MKVAIINYGAGNVRSLQFAFERLSITSVISANPEEIRTADRVVFPGQGEAKSAMAKLKESHIDRLIPALKQPVLGICLGMQLLCSHTKEGDTKGLGIIAGNVVRFPCTVKTPQMGWNTVRNLTSPLFKGIPEEDYMYLVHSYYVPLCSETIAESHYHAPYSVAVQKNNFYGVQFHPEKSSSSGLQILANFLTLKS